MAPVEFTSLTVSSGLFGLNGLGILNQAEMVRKVLISVLLVLSLLDFNFMMMYVNDILISQAIL